MLNTSENSTQHEKDVFSDPDSPLGTLSTQKYIPQPKIHYTNEEKKFNVNFFTTLNCSQITGQY